MRYLLLISADEDIARESMARGEFADFEAWMDDLERRGVLELHAGLELSDTATTVRVREGKAMLTDGPFAETHEHLGGYYLLDCRDLDEALELAEMVPQAHFGATIEVRPVDHIPGLNHGVA